MHSIFNLKHQLDMVEHIAGIGSWRVDLVQGRLYWSDHVYTIHGVTRENYKPELESAINFYHPEDSDYVQEVVNQAIQHKEDFQFELRIVRADGEIRWVHSKGECEQNEVGDVIAVNGIFQDITDPKKSQKQLDTFFNLSVSLHCIATPTHFLHLNSGFTETLGYSKEELLSRPFLEFVHPDDWNITDAEVKHLESGRVTLDFENRYRHKNGKYILLSWSSIFDPEENLIYAAARDITQERRQANLLQEYNQMLQIRNKELDDFAYSASHDLKAPLRAIDNLSNWILEDAFDLLPQDSQQHLNHLRQRVHRMEQLLDDLLQYSRAGRSEYPLEKVNFTTFQEEVISPIELPDGFTIQVPEDFPSIHTHRIPLNQVFSNLINNAIKHHDKDQGVIVIDWEKNGDMIFFNIRDDGPGIDAAFHERIFQMFQTLKPRDDVEGSGMGLALVQKLVHNYGGEITVSSNPVKGTTFTFSWPVTISNKFTLIPEN